jgi:hypothetical protein
MVMSPAGLETKTTALARPNITSASARGRLEAAVGWPLQPETEAWEADHSQLHAVARHRRVSCGRDHSWEGVGRIQPART